MKIKVTKGDKSLSYNLMDSWADVTLDKWAKLVSLETETKTEQAIETIGILADIPRQILRELSLSSVSIIVNRIAEMQQNSGSELVRRITVDGEDYGFHPNLEDLTLGEYADVETLIKDGLEKNLHLLMAILYRPITETEGDTYTIEAYDGNITIRAEKFKKMKAPAVESSMVFFWTLGKELLKSLPLSLMELASKTVHLTQPQGFKRSGAGLE